MAHILPSGGGKALMNVEDSVLLLLDHQSGLFQTVKDITVAELRANVSALARIATLLKIPVVTTASVPDGPNGPPMPEIAKLAPHAVYTPRQGEVNAWDNDLFVKTVRETGKKTLIMAGVWTSGVSCFRPSTQRPMVLMSMRSSMHPAIRAKWHLGRRLHVLSSPALCPLAQMR
jgi:nicotinamidase-related amidase